MLEKDYLGDPHTIESAATLLWTRTAKLRTERRVTSETRDKIQTAFKELLKTDGFRRGIESSRPDVEECHIIFSPYIDLAKESLAWWIYPYIGIGQFFPRYGYKLMSQPYFCIDPESGGIGMYFDEGGNIMLPGFDDSE